MKWVCMHMLRVTTHCPQAVWQQMCISFHLVIVMSISTHDLDMLRFNWDDLRPGSKCL